MSDVTVADKPKAQPPQKPPAPRVPLPPLGNDRWRMKEFENPGHCIYVQHGTTIEDVLTPSFWANVAGKLRAGNTCEIHWDDFSEFAEVYVRSAGRNWASVALLRHVKLEAAEAPQAREKYDVSYNGVVDKFRIMRLTDNAVIRAGFATEMQARTWLDEYKRKLQA